jgi:hypothetical protein
MTTATSTSEQIDAAQRQLASQVLSQWRNEIAVRQLDDPGLLDIEHPWDDPATFEREPDMQPCDGRSWPNADRVVEGPSWGGNLEIISWLLMAGIAVGPVNPMPAGARPGNLRGVAQRGGGYRILRNMGERGLLRQFPAALVGRTKAWSSSPRP